MQLTSNGTLKQRVLNAGSWTLGGHVLGQLIRLGSNLLMTRMLVPEAFGLMGIVIVLMIGFALFSDLGISQNIVRSPRGDDAAFLDTAWTVQIVRGVFIWILATLSAIALPWASSHGWIKAGTVYADPLLPWVIAAYSLTTVISGFTSTKVATARRHMKLRGVTQIEVISQLVALVAMAAFAWWSHSIWALVAGSLISSLISMLLGHMVLPGHANHLAWDRSIVIDLLSFGKWVFLSSMIGFLVVNGDRLLLGGMIDAQTMGQYTIAFLLVNAVQMVMSMATGNVVFPALSEVALQRPADLAVTANKFQRLGDIFLVSACGFLIVAGSTIVGLLYDSRYQSAGPMLSMLAIGTIGLRYQVVEQCYLALGKPYIGTVTNLLRLAVLYAGLPIAFNFYQFSGAMAVIVASQFAGWPVAIYFKIKYGLMDLRVELTAIPLLAAGLLLGFAFKFVMPTRHVLRSILNYS